MQQIDENILQLVPAEFAYRHKVIPLELENGVLRVALCDVSDAQLLSDLEFLTGRCIEPVQLSDEEIHLALEEFYGANIPERELLGKLGEEFQLVEKGRELFDDHKLRQQVDELSVVNLVNKIITEAINCKASDIHIEPYQEQFRVRYRIDGILHESMRLPLERKYAIISRLKIMADLDIAEKRRPQDGRIRVKRGNRVIDIRVSTLPTDFGEKVVLRILDKDQLNLELEKLGFEVETLQLFKRAICSPYGMILVTGPTGSGKTTTLYATLNYLNSPEVNILTIEDPIEYNLPGINQAQVRSDIGFTFAKALRAFLRQDPDIIMVGEIRDTETAEIAIRAALTGHLVFSTLHTNDAPSAVTRLLDMGLEPFLVASSLKMVIAQRLVRKVCDHCKIKTSQNLKQMKGLDCDFGSDPIYKGQGCKKCRSTGYRGRTAIFEVMSISPMIAEMIHRHATASELKTQACQEGMSTLRQSALFKVKQGITTPEEILRETGE